MKYSLILSDKFDRIFSQLDKSVQDRVVERLKELTGNPKLGKPLKGKLKGIWSLRVGKYRILYQVQEEKLVIFVITLGHRKQVYK